MIFHICCIHINSLYIASCSVNLKTLKMSIKRCTLDILCGVEGMRILAVQGRVRDRAGPQAKAVPALPRHHRPQL